MGICPKALLMVMGCFSDEFFGWTVGALVQTADVNFPIHFEEVVLEALANML